LRDIVKKQIRVAYIIITALGVLMLAIYLLLWLPAVQQKVKDIALDELMKITHNRMSIGNLYFRPFNQLKLENVYVEDQKGDTLLFAEKASATFHLSRLLKQQIRIKSIDLEKFIINLNKDSINGNFNFQFLVDAFASDTPDTTASKFTVQIRDIALKEGRFRYDVNSEPFLSDSVFDFNHIYISNIQSNIDLNSIEANHLDIEVKHLSFTEKSRLNVAQLEVKIFSEGEKIGLDNLSIQFLRSRLLIPEVRMEKENVEIVLGESAMNLADFNMFYSGLSNFADDNLLFSGKIKGKLPQIQITQFQANYGKHANLKFTGSIEDYNQWKKSPIQFDLNRLSIDDYEMGRILSLVSGNQEQVPFKMGGISLSGVLQGTLASLLAHFTLQSDQGTIQLEGDGGFDFDTGMSHFNAAIDAENLDIRTLLQDSIYGLTDLHLQSRGSIDASGKMNLMGEIQLDRFDYNAYSYNQIQAEGSYSGDTIQLNLNSNDSCVNLQVKALANMDKKKPGIQLSADVRYLYLDTLNFISGYKDVSLISKLTVGVEGLDPENMRVDATVDNLSLRTDKGVFYEPRFNLAYQAGNNNKRLNISSRTINARANGNFTYAGIEESLKEIFPMLFPNSKRRPNKKDSFAQNLNFRLGMKNIRSISDLLDFPSSIPDSILFIGKYSNDGSNVQLSTSAYTLFSESDTLQLSLLLANKQNNLSVIFNVDNKSSKYDLDGSIDAEVEFIPKKGSFVPDMQIALNPSVWVLNETYFQLNPAKIEIEGGRYSIHDLLIHSANNVNEYVKTDGIISASREDSLVVDISQFQLSTIFGATKTDIPLSGVADGRIIARNLLSTPFLFAREFSIHDIILNQKALGNLSISSGWSSRRNGLALRATLDRENSPQSTMQGIILPEKDSLSLSANIKGVELQWLQDWMQGTLHGLSGSLSTEFKVEGKISAPVITGKAYFNRTTFGIDMLNTLYSTSDSISFNSNVVEFNRFTILDENDHPLTINGQITHQNFAEFKPLLSISLSDFLLLNNERQIDSLFYGNLRVNGILNVKQKNKDWLISGNITHSNLSTVMINIPYTPSTAVNYDGITYINIGEENQDALEKKRKAKDNFTLPLKIDLSLWLDTGLTLGAVFNPATHDAARIAGSGSLQWTYDMNTAAMSILGNYIVESGNATLSLANITRKSFTIQQGGKLVFRGDPMATSFDLTALYNLRADLTTLDQGFEKYTTTKTPVACSLTASGNWDKMELKYRVLLPGESEDMQRKLDGLLHTEDLRIKEIAYLLAFGTFYPLNSNQNTGTSQIWTSLASSSITGQLNNLLSNALGSQWSIGTNLRTKDSNFDNVDMDVNISTRLFNDRLTINGTVGMMHGDNMDQSNNFTGDFDMEYKLIPSGNILLKFYNVTNNRYFELAKTTQGVGVIYKRNARTFKKLFDKFKKK